MKNVQVKIKGANKPLDLYILDFDINCVTPKYEECYNKDGHLIGVIETGSINNKITLEDIIKSLYYENGFVRSKFSFIETKKMTYNCSNIYAVYRISRVNCIETSIERHIFEEVLRFNNDMKSIIYEDSIERFDYIKKGIVLRSTGSDIMKANFFVEESI